MKTRHQELQQRDEGWRPMSPVNPTERFKPSSTLWAQRNPRPRTCILKAGAAYVPLDPEYLANRVEHILEMERDILQDLHISPDSDSMEYLHHNLRVVNRIDSIELARSY